MFLFVMCIFAPTNLLLLCSGVSEEDLFDRLVFRKMREAMGGRLRCITTGSAPISQAVLDFTRCVFGCVVVEGYGQTECVAVATVSCVFVALQVVRQ